jgi:hypothetical protein
MGYEIYVNYLASMEAHIGVLVRDTFNGPVRRDMEFARPVAPHNTQLLAYVSVFSNGNDFPNAATVDQVIDEGLQQIGNPARATTYTQHTANGTFQLMWRPGFPATSEGAKRAIHEVVARLGHPGTDNAIYAGRPDRLFRYGRRDHLLAALRQGRFRIGNAAYYNDLAGDAARQDDELRRAFEREPSSLVIRTQDGTVLQPRGNVRFVSSRASDYYVFCLSMDYTRAVAEQFNGSEACLRINNPEVFAERLHAGVEAQLPHFTGLDAPVSYGTRSVHGVCFTKANGYTVQSEYRFAWTNTDDARNRLTLDPIFIGIGSIEDIAEIVELPV